MKPVLAYRQPCFLPTPPTPDGDIDLAAPEPETAASTPPTSCADFASLAGTDFLQLRAPGLYPPVYSSFPDFPYCFISRPVYQQEQQLLFKEPHVPRAPQEPQQQICDLFQMLLILIFDVLPRFRGGGLSPIRKHVHPSVPGMHPPFLHFRAQSIDLFNAGLGGSP